MGEVKKVGKPGTTPPAKLTSARATRRPDIRKGMKPPSIPGKS